MPWIGIEVVTDADKDDVGTATAQWETAAGVQLQPYSRRAKLTLAEADAFVQEAIADRDEQLARMQRDANLSSTLADRFTAAGEEVVV